MSLPLPTRRLLFRRWTEADLPFARRLWGDPDVTRHIDARGALDDGAVRARLDEELGRELQYWVLTDRDGAFIGCAGLRPSDRSDAPVELGFHIVRDAWGRGYAFEAARSVLVHAFDVLAVSAVFAGHHPDNAASAHLLDKLGFAHVGEDLYPPTGLHHPSYLRRAPSASGTNAVYDHIADEYLDRLGDELSGKPFDRDWLTALAARRRDETIVDLGCGPGHISRFLADAGAIDVVGVDRSAGMVERACRAFPDLAYAVGDMTVPATIPRASAVLLMYSIVHLPTRALADVFSGLRTRVAPGGELLASFHVGDTFRGLDEWWGHDVVIDFQFHPTEAVVAALEAGGWRVTDVHVRDPYPDVEYPSRRAYLTATNPG